jgi:hypothetical protein
MDQRQSERIEVNIPAVAEFQGEEFSNCQVRDYSEGGIFFQCQNAYSQKDVLPAFFLHSCGYVILVKTKFFSSKFRIVRITNKGLGATFIRH